MRLTKEFVRSPIYTRRARENLQEAVCQRHVYEKKNGGLLKSKSKQRVSEGKRLQKVKERSQMEKEIHITLGAMSRKPLLVWSRLIYACAPLSYRFPEILPADKRRRQRRVDTRHPKHFRVPSEPVLSRLTHISGVLLPVSGVYSDRNHPKVDRGPFNWCRVLDFVFKSDLCSSSCLHFHPPNHFLLSTSISLFRLALSSR